MFRRLAVIVTGLLLVGIIACSRETREPAQTQQPAAQQPAAQPAAQPAPAAAPPAEPAPREAAAPPSAQPASPAPRRASTTPKQAPAAPKATEPAVTTAGEAKPAAVVPAAPKQVTEAQPAAAPPPAPKVTWIPSGTRFEIRLEAPISSADNKAGDTFRGTLDQDLEADGKVVVPKGSAVKGKIIDVKQPGRVEGRAAMSIALTEIEVGKTSYPIQTNTLAFEAEKSTKKDATKIGIGAAAGAIIGAIAGGGKGAAIGAAVGGGAGTATVLATKGDQVKFGTEDKFSFVLRSDLGIK